MKKKIIAGAAVGACLLQLAVLPAVDAATDWKPELLSPAKGARGPVDPIRLRLPTLPNSVLERLMLELDDFDVTALVTREGRDAVFTPPVPLPYGIHQLRLAEYAADGAVIERGVWTFDVRKAASFREAELRAGSTLNVTQRIADKDLPATAPGKTQGNGAAQISGMLADGDWRVQGNMDLIYNSQNNSPPPQTSTQTQQLAPLQQRQLDVGRYLIKAENGLVTGAAGHQSIGPDSLVMQGFNRRGVSLGLGREDSPVSATAFSLRAEDIIGFQEGLGIGDSNNRVSGLVVVGRPANELMLATTYVAGEGPSQTGAVGTGIAGDPFSTGGRAASVVADGNLWDRSVRLRGEYAASRFDFDGVDTGSAEENSRAYTALVTYAPWQNKIVDGQPMVLSVGAENRRIGTFFRSPANPIGPRDRTGTRAFGSFGWGGFSTQGSFGKEHDNVDDLALLPSAELKQTLLGLNYFPQLTLVPPQDPAQPPALPWFGQPNFNLTYLNFDQNLAAATGGTTSGLHETHNLSLVASFNYANWMWALGHSIGTDEDRSRVRLAPDTHSQMTQLSANLRIGDKLTVGPGIQRSKIETRNDPINADKNNDTLSAILNLGYAFTERLNGNLGYNLNRQKADDNSIDTRSRDLIGALNWIVTPARGQRSGLALALEGQRHQVDDGVITANNQNSYQIFFKVSMTWLPVF